MTPFYEPAFRLCPRIDGIGRPGHRPPGLDQNLDTQLDALQKIGCHEIFQDKITGLATTRPALDQLLVKLRPGDTVVVARFFRQGQQLAKAKGKHVGRPVGINAEAYANVKKAVERGLSVNETVALTGISMSSVKRYRKQLARRSD